MEQTVESMSPRFDVVLSAAKWKIGSQAAQEKVQPSTASLPMASTDPDQRSVRQTVVLIVNQRTAIRFRPFAAAGQATEHGSFWLLCKVRLTKRRYECEYADVSS